MSLDASNVEVAVTGALYLAPLDTPLPTDSETPLNDAFRNVGYLSEDGITETPEEDTQEIRAWQNGDIVRRSVGEMDAVLTQLRGRIGRAAATSNPPPPVDRSVALALTFGGVQFAIMFWGYALPAPVDWVPLLVMSLTVGLFEAVFFRGFIQGRLEDSFGTAAGVAGAGLRFITPTLTVIEGAGGLWVPMPGGTWLPAWIAGLGASPVVVGRDEELAVLGELSADVLRASAKLLKPCARRRFPLRIALVSGSRPSSRIARDASNLARNRNRAARGARLRVRATTRRARRCMAPSSRRRPPRARSHRGSSPSEHTRCTSRPEPAAD